MAARSPSHAALDHEREAALLRWYDDSARDLPWRRTRDPFAVWVSEAMLQQTRVGTVLPYWERFLERFPTIEGLAAAPEDDVLAAWSGLGYYRRARSLQAAARAIVERHGGRFPDTREEALALPGIGPYTAGAVLSIAYGRPEPVVDGNVMRVFARWFELEDPWGSAGLARRSWALAADLLPAERPAAWNQALMELGATICRPRDPDCARCPVARRCAALAAGRVAELPRPGPKSPAIDVAVVVFVVARGGELLLERRPDGGRMAGLWQLPTVERPPVESQESDGGAGATARERDGTRLFPSELPDGWQLDGVELGRLRHGITCHRLAIEVRGVTAAERGPERSSERWRWHERHAIEALPRTGMTKKALRAPFVARWLDA